MPKGGEHRYAWSIRGKEMDSIGICHIGIAVKNLEQASKLYREVFFMEVMQTKVLQEHGIKVMFLKAGPVEIELMEPLSERSAVARYLRKHGQGVQHVAFSVENLDNARDTLLLKGVPVMEQEMRGAQGERVSFIHPDASGGLLLELVENCPDGSSESGGHVI
jgi:methylmalonyl-CoA/ethylmalonyl-CoA epimerase